MKTVTSTNIAEQATAFANSCRYLGWTWECRRGGSIVTITKRFAAGDREAYSIADGEAYSLLAMVPLKGGSVWGTDGGSIGGYSGLMSGRYVLNKSGESGKRFCAALAKINSVGPAISSKRFGTGYEYEA